MRWTSLILAIVLLTTAPAALASETPAEVTLTIVAKEDDCPGEATFCYEVTDGSLSEIQPGTHVTITFENHGEAEHELMARTLSGLQVAPTMGMDANATDDHGQGDHADGTSTPSNATTDGNEGTDHGQASNATDEDKHNDTQHPDGGNETTNDGHDSHADEQSDGNETDQTSQGTHGSDDGTGEDNHTGMIDEGHGGAMAGDHGDHLVPPGGTRTITFIVPEDAEGVYLWCSLPGHEELGMQEETVFETQATGDETANPAPLPAVPALIATLAVGAVVLGWRPHSNKRE